MQIRSILRFAEDRFQRLRELCPFLYSIPGANVWRAHHLCARHRTDRTHGWLFGHDQAFLPIADIGEQVWKIQPNARLPKIGECEEYCRTRH
jgi:hypothetical protein